MLSKTMGNAGKTAGMQMGTLIVFFVFSFIIVPGIGYVIFFFIIPSELMEYQKYNIYVEEIKKLGQKSIILYIISLAVIYILFKMGYDREEDLFFICTISAIISLIFLRFALKKTKKERNEIKQIEEFYTIIEDMIDEKRPIIKQVLSLHGRGSDKYNEILRAELNDIIQKAQNQLDVSPVVVDEAKKDIINVLKSI